MVKIIPAKTYDSIKYKSFIKADNNFANAADLAYEYDYYNHRVFYIFTQQ